MFLCSVLESNCVWPSNIKLLWPAVLKSEANQGEREKGERTGNGVRCFRKLSGVDWLIPDGKGHPSWPRKYSLGESSWLVKGKGLGVRDHSGMHIPLPFIHKTLVFNLWYKTIGLPSPSGEREWLDQTGGVQHFYVHNLLTPQQWVALQCRSKDDKGVCCISVAPWRCLQIRSNIWEGSGPDLNLAFRPVPETAVFIYPRSQPAKCRVALTLLWWMGEVNTNGAARGERSESASSAPAGSENRGCSTLTSSTEDNFSLVLVLQGPLQLEWGSCFVPNIYTQVVIQQGMYAYL